ncbi:MAG: tRNA (adenosine(37)-N6)-dimethylallyltransferase MiaA [Mailhella sp.]|nr:tRNA (adenosine(37)-N6)-dimethylallyltransferase MiaA [Mailhella sp.]
MKIVCLCGPTASGKSAAALGLAAAGIPMWVINADSRQVYRDFPIITAAPDESERGVCPHILYGFMRTEEKNAAGIWAKPAGQTLREAESAGVVPVLTGGTGMYFRALLDGLADIPQIPQEIHDALIDECASAGPQALHRRLAAIDPEYAASIHENDKQRIMRALEVYAATGRTFSSWHADTPKPYAGHDILRIGIGLPLEELTPILMSRTQKMLRAGALEEAERALAICPDTRAPGWSGIGCRELARYLKGEFALQAAVDMWNKNTRAYAKRQWTWFRADTRIRWFRPEEQKDCLEAVKRFLGM